MLDIWEAAETLSGVAARRYPIGTILTASDVTMEQPGRPDLHDGGVGGVMVRVQIPSVGRGHWPLPTARFIAGSTALV